MERIANLASTFIKPAEPVFNKTLKPVLGMKIIKLVVTLLLIASVFASMEKVPEKYKDILRHPAVQYVLAFAAFFVMSKDFVVSVAGAAIVVGAYYLVMYVSEGFDMVTGKVITKEECLPTKIDDLVKLFDGDMDKLKQAMTLAKVPNFVKMIDGHAPLIATYLIQYGTKVSAECKQP